MYVTEKEKYIWTGGFYCFYLGAIKHAKNKNTLKNTLRTH